MDNAIAFANAPTLDASSTDLAAEIAALAPWSQNLILPDGTPTAPDHADAHVALQQWEQFRDFLPADLAGCTALVIGCNAGCHALELARRGARVTGIDESSHFLRQAQWAAQRCELADRIQLYRGRVHELARWPGRHDVVIWVDQLQRLRYPRLALDIVAALAQRCLVLGAQAPQPGASGQESDFAWPLDDATIVALLRSAGHDVVARPGPGLYLGQPRVRLDTVPRWNEPEFIAATGSLPPGLVRFGDDPAFAFEGALPVALGEKN